MADFALALVTDSKIKTFKSLHEVAIDTISCLLTTNKILTKIKSSDSMIVKVCVRLINAFFIFHFCELLHFFLLGIEQHR